MTPSSTLGFDILVLSTVPGIGQSRLKQLISHFRTLDAVQNASPRELASVPQIGEHVAHSVHQFFSDTVTVQRHQDRIRDQLDHLPKDGIHLLTFWDEAYPIRLKQLTNAPVYLFVKGTLSPSDDRAVAMVGTRNPTEYGRNAAKKIATELASAGVTVVSGLALGIDSEAHRAALDAGGRTIAVLGHGINTIYTDRSGKLWPRILEHGAIITEEWPNTPPTADNFPKRNRIISGLSLGVVVVESDRQGGALITANYALEHNRDLFAVPGSIFSKKSNGTNDLIKEGAQVATSGRDILDSLQLLNPAPNPRDPQSHLPLPEMNDDEVTVFNALGIDTLHIDSLAEKTGLDLGDLLTALFELELKGCVLQLSGRNFKKSATYL